MAPLPRILSLSLALVAVPVAQCCMGVGNQAVTFNGQKNIVIWNPKTHMEHFIRDAKFDATVPDLGFIAPTPTQPDLGEAKENAFTLLNSLDPRPRYAFGRGGMGGGAFDAAKGSVTVYEEKDVAGYHAAVLKATDSDALEGWLKANGYKVNDREQAWLDFYIAKNWFFTAFKVLKNDQPDKDVKAAPIRTGAIRMSFKATEPYNPYYVPEDNVPSRYRSTDSLSVLFVSPGTYAPTIGRNTEWVGGKVQWQADMPDAMGYQIARDIGIKGSAMPQDCKVTAYLDPQFPRKSWDDIFFHQVSGDPAEAPVRANQIGNAKFGGTPSLAFLGFGLLPLFWIRRAKR